MSDSKIYMFPESGYDRGHDSALWAMLANNNKSTSDPLAAMAMMNGGGMGMWNNPLTH